MEGNDKAPAFVLEAMDKVCAYDRALAAALRKGARDGLEMFRYVDIHRRKDMAIVVKYLHLEAALQELARLHSAPSSKPMAVPVKGKAA